VDEAAAAAAAAAAEQYQDRAQSHGHILLCTNSAKQGESAWVE
jgi:hypothetical protein